MLDAARGQGGRIIRARHRRISAAGLSFIILASCEGPFPTAAWRKHFYDMPRRSSAPDIMPTSAAKEAARASMRAEISHYRLYDKIIANSS